MDRLCPGYSFLSLRADSAVVHQRAICDGAAVAQGDGGIDKISMEVTMTHAEFRNDTRSAHNWVGVAVHAATGVVDRSESSGDVVFFHVGRHVVRQTFVSSEWHSIPERSGSSVVDWRVVPGRRLCRSLGNANPNGDCGKAGSSYEKTQKFPSCHLGVPPGRLCCSEFSLAGKPLRDDRTAFRKATALEISGLECLRVVHQGPEVAKALGRKSLPEQLICV